MNSKEAFTKWSTELQQQEIGIPGNFIILAAIKAMW